MLEMKGDRRMDQIKIGSFLRELRKEKAPTAKTCRSLKNISCQSKSDHFLFLATTTAPIATSARDTPAAAPVAGLLSAGAELSLLPPLLLLLEELELLEELLS